MNWDDLALVGRVARAHGIRGQVIVNPETDFPRDRFVLGARLFLKGPGGAPEAVSITSVRFQHDRPVIGLGGIDDMTAASKLAGAELRVPFDSLMTLPQGTFYRHDLVGCVVHTHDGARVGVVKEIEGPMERSRLVVETAGGEVLIPMVEAICTTIDTVKKRIVIEPPEGLLELNAR